MDAVVFRDRNRLRELLLIARKNEPFKGEWALPGGFVDEGEDLADAARRELLEETGVDLAGLVQLKAFGAPGRDPRHHTVSVAFFGFAPPDAIAVAADDADSAQWFPISSLPKLAFDHAEIISFAIKTIS